MTIGWALFFTILVCGIAAIIEKCWNGIKSLFSGISCRCAENEACIEDTSTDPDALEGELITRSMDEESETETEFNSVAEGEPNSQDEEKALDPVVEPISNVKSNRTAVVESGNSRFYQCEEVTDKSENPITRFCRISISGLPIGTPQTADVPFDECVDWLLGTGKGV